MHPLNPMIEQTDEFLLKNASLFLLQPVLFFLSGFYFLQKILTTIMKSDDFSRNGRGEKGQKNTNFQIFHPSLTFRSQSANSNGNKGKGDANCPQSLSLSLPSFFPRELIGPPFKEVPWFDKGGISGWKCEINRK